MMRTLKEMIEKVGTQTLWGQEIEGNDVLCKRALGDGKKLIVITMLSSRPFSHYIRVDSRMSLDYKDWEEEVFEALEEEFGDSERMLYDEDSDYNQDNLPSFPVVDSSNGYTYGVVRWRDLNKETSHKSEADYIKQYQVHKAYGRYKKKKHLLEENNERYHSLFWKIIGDDLTRVSIKNVLDYEEKKIKKDGIDEENTIRKSRNKRRI